MSKKILLCGYGAIGSRMYPDYKALGDVTVYDPKFKNTKDLPGDNFYGDFDEIKKLGKFDFAILALPTPTVNGQCDTSIVKNVIYDLKDVVDVIIVRSTVYVGFMDEIKKEVSNVVFSPEFYGTTQHQVINDFLILAGDRDLTRKVAQLWWGAKKGDFKIKFYDDMKTAELIKYMENCFLALKVVFCNSFYFACKKAGVEYDDVREGWLMDSRVNPSHTIVYDDHHFYDSHCFNKDVPAFANQFDDPLMKRVVEINDERRKTS